MKSRSTRNTAITTLTFCTLMITGCSSGPSSVPLNFGDGSAAGMFYQIGERKKVDDWNQVIIYADKIVESFGGKAAKLQASLSDYPPTSKNVWRYDDLNNVGRALLVKGNAMQKKNDTAGAKTAYNTIIDKYGYAQYQEVGKWKKAAEVAKKRLQSL